MSNLRLLVQAPPEQLDFVCGQPEPFDDWSRLAPDGPLDQLMLRYQALAAACCYAPRVPLGPATLVSTGALASRKLGCRAVAWWQTADFSGGCLLDSGRIVVSLHDWPVHRDLAQALEQCFAVSGPPLPMCKFHGDYRAKEEGRTTYIYRPGEADRIELAASDDPIEFNLEYFLAAGAAG